MCVTECLLAPSKRAGCPVDKSSQVRTAPTITAGADELQPSVQARARLLLRRVNAEELPVAAGREQQGERDGADARDAPNAPMPRKQ